MEKMLLKDKNNKIFEADIVRYFKYGYDYFLIYTLGEKDEKDYNILYLVEILEELGELISVNIKDEEQWKGMQKIVKNVIKEIRKGKEISFEDLDYKEIEKIKIVDPRFFKMETRLVNILASNYINGVNIDDDMNEPELDDIEFEKIEPIDLPNEEVIIPVLEKSVNESEDNTMNEEKDIKVIETNETVNDIDYKALYYALKEEKDATDLLVNDLMEELMKYKEKYGEIE